MATPTVKLKPGAKNQDLSPDSFVLTGSNTVTRLITLLGTVSHAPVTATDTLGPLVPNCDALGSSINHYWRLPQGYGYRAGDIATSQTVQELADDIDSRVTAAQKAGLPAGYQP